MQLPRIIMSHEDFQIFEYYNRCYVLTDNMFEEVYLSKIMPAEDYHGKVIDFGGDFNGITDDQEWAVSFSLNPSDKIDLESINKMGILVPNGCLF